MYLHKLALLLKICIAFLSKKSAKYNQLKHTENPRQPTSGGNAAYSEIPILWQVTMRDCQRDPLMLNKADCAISVFPSCGKFNFAFECKLAWSAESPTHGIFLVLISFSLYFALQSFCLGLIPCLTRYVQLYVQLLWTQPTHPSTQWAGQQRKMLSSRERAAGLEPAAPPCFSCFPWFSSSCQASSEWGCRDSQPEEQAGEWTLTSSHPQPAVLLFSCSFLLKKNQKNWLPPVGWSNAVPSSR